MCPYTHTFMLQQTVSFENRMSTCCNIVEIQQNSCTTYSYTCIQLHHSQKFPLADFHLSGPYTRPILPYGMAITKGSSPDAPEGGVVKKPRTVFTPKQLLYLEEEFLKNQFPNMEQRRNIAKALDLTQQHIQVHNYMVH